MIWEKIYSSNLCYARIAQNQENIKESEWSLHSVLRVNSISREDVASNPNETLIERRTFFFFWGGAKKTTTGVNYMLPGNELSGSQKKLTAGPNEKMEKKKKKKSIP